MIGPSAPKGPPVPIAMAAERGLRNVNRAGNAAVIGEDLLHRLRDAVSSNGLRTEPGHQAHDQSADHRHDDHPQAQRIAGRATSSKRPALKKGQVGEQRDQPHQHEGRDRGRGPQPDRHGTQSHHAAIDDRRSPPEPGPPRSPNRATAKSSNPPSSVEFTLSFIVYCPSDYRRWGTHASAARSHRRPEVLTNGRGSRGRTISTVKSIPRQPDAIRGCVTVYS